MSLRQAITVKYLCSTNLKDARLEATCIAGSITTYWDHGTEVEENYHHAASLLLIKIKWSELPGYSHLVVGVVTNGDYVFIPIFK